MLLKINGSSVDILGLKRSECDGQGSDTMQLRSYSNCLHRKYSVGSPAFIIDEKREEIGHPARPTQKAWNSYSIIGCPWKYAGPILRRHRGPSRSCISFPGEDSLAHHKGGPALVVS